MGFRRRGYHAGMAKNLQRAAGSLFLASITADTETRRDAKAMPWQILLKMYTVPLHIMEHAKEYGGDPSRIALTGDSAGGHLSAACANMPDKIGGANSAKPKEYSIYAGISAEEQNRSAGAC
jgi:dienelactone hydrolase